jgi:hypothetical protein
VVVDGDRVVSEEVATVSDRAPEPALVTAAIVTEGHVFGCGIVFSITS